MKAILEFNLDDIDDRIHHRRCMKVDDIYSVLTTYSRELEKRIDSSAGEGWDYRYKEALSDLHKLFYEILGKYDVLLFDE